jgi:hypothetical protein
MNYGLLKYNRIFLSIAVLFCAAFLTGCDNGIASLEEDDGGLYTGAIIVFESSGTIYYSLTTGEEVDEADKGTTGWDIAFKRTRLVLTNSGDTAAKLVSGGNGGVWHTGKKNFGSVTLADKKTFDFAPVQGNTASVNYNTDTSKWVEDMNGTSEKELNVMSFVGYDKGDGMAEATKFPNNSYTYDQHQYYGFASMGDFPSTNEVYIIGHADGVSFSKIQIRYEYIPDGVGGLPPRDVFVIKYKKLE